MGPFSIHKITVGAITMKINFFFIQNKKEIFTIDFVHLAMKTVIPGGLFEKKE